jgi:hypothetical protein
MKQRFPDPRDVAAGKALAVRKMLAARPPAQVAASSYLVAARLSSKGLSGLLRHVGAFPLADMSASEKRGHAPALRHRPPMRLD